MIRHHGGSERCAGRVEMVVIVELLSTYKINCSATEVFICETLLFFGGEDVVFCFGNRPVFVQWNRSVGLEPVLWRNGGDFRFNFTPVLGGHGGVDPFLGR